MADPKMPANDDTPLDPALERHLAYPAEKTEEVSGEQARARQGRAHEPVPTDPAADTENQPS